MTTNTIPDAIDRIATDIVRADYSNEPEPDYALYAAIAQAIHDAVMAERERCARLMEDDGEWTFAGSPSAMAIFEDVRELAADAIRAAPKAEEA